MVANTAQPLRDVGLASSPSTGRAITWLHVSDLHVCPAKYGGDQLRMLDGLLVDVTQQSRARGIRPDVVFVTGDLAYGSTPESRLAEQYAAVASFLDRLRQCFDPPIPKSRFFIVPGNHDVNREMIQRSHVYWDSEGVAVSEVERVFSGGGTSDLTSLLGRLTEYAAFLRESGYGEHVAGDPRLVYGHVLDVGAVKVGIVGLNSAWLSGPSTQRSGQLRMAGKAQVDALHPAVKDADVRIAVVHHPGHCLREDEHGPYWRDSVRTKRFHFCLHGHLHESWVDPTPGRIGHLTVGVGAGYESDDRYTGYNLARADLDRQSVAVQFRKYVCKAGGGWTAEVIPNVTDADGVYVVPLASLGQTGSPVPDAAATGPAFAARLQAELSKGLGQRLAGLPEAQGMVVNVSVNVAIVPPGATMGSGDALDASFREIECMVQRGDYLGAVAAAEGAEARLGSAIRANDKAKLLGLRGQALLAMGDEQGLGMLRESEVCSVDPPVGLRVIYALRRLEEGRVDEAFRIADSIRAQDTTMRVPGARVVWILSAPQGGADHLAAQLTAEEGAHPLVRTALADRAYRQGDYAASERHARDALRAEPDDVQTMEILAHALMGKTLGAHVRRGLSLPPLSADRWPDFREVERLLRTVLDRRRSNHLPKRTAQSLTNLSLVYVAVGLVAEATACALDGLALAPTDLMLVERYLDLLERQARHSEVVAFCMSHGKMVARSASLTVRFAQNLLQTDVAGDEGDAEVLLVGLLRRAEPLTGTEIAWVVGLLGELWFRQDRLDDLAELIARKAEEPVLASLCSLFGARVARARGDERGALVCAEEALRLLPDSEEVRFSLLPRIAFLLDSLGRHDLAWPCWQRLSPLTDLTDQGRRLILSAYRAGEFKVVVDYCAALRASGSHDPDQIRAEVAASERLSRLATEQLLAELLDAPGCAAMRTHLLAWYWYLRGANGNLGAGEVDAGALPAVSGLDELNTGVQVVEVLKRAGKLADALQYAYLLVQRYPDDVASYHALVFCLLPDGLGYQFPQPDVVGLDCAVSFRVGDDASPQTVVIDDTPFSSVARGERPPTDPLVDRMMGRRVGDPFVFAPPPVERVATITGITDKVLFRIRESMAHLQERFPDEARCWMLKVDPSMGQEGLGSVLSVLRQRADYLDRCDQVYRAAKLPLYSYAMLAHQPLVACLLHIGATEGLSFNWATGSEQERSHMVSLLGGGARLAVGPSTLGVLTVLHAKGTLDVPSVLTRSGHRLMLSEYTLSDFRQYVADLSSPGAGTLAWADGRAVWQSVDAVAAGKQAKRANALLGFIVSHADIVAGDLPPQPPDPRTKELAGVLGRAALHTMLLAQRDPALVLWEDDGRAVVAASKHLSWPSVRRVCTQVVLLELRSRHLVDAHTVAQTSIVFLGLGCRFTSIDGLTIAEALAAAGNQSSRFPANRVLALVGDSTVDPPSLVGVVNDFLRAVWLRKAPDRSVRRATALVFKALAARGDGRGRAIMEAATATAVDAVQQACPARAKLLRKLLRTIC